MLEIILLVDVCTIFLIKIRQIDNTQLLIVDFMYIFDMMVIYNGHCRPSFEEFVTNVDII